MRRRISGEPKIKLDGLLQIVGLQAESAEGDHKDAACCKIVPFEISQ